jgi:uncharacterized protein YggT (Ycf19 family)
MNQHIASEVEHEPKVLLLRASRVLSWFVYAFVVLVVILLTIAFVLELFGANPSAGFSQWIYDSTERAMQPFRGLFPPVEVTDKSTLDVSLLFAMFMYGLVALGVNALINWLTHTLHTTERRAARRLQAEELAAQRPPAYDPRIGAGPATDRLPTTPSPAGGTNPTNPTNPPTTNG